MSTSVPAPAECAASDGLAPQDAIPTAAVHHYRRLADGLSHLIEEGRLTRDILPDDYDWIVEHLAAIAGADPGQEECIVNIREFRNSQ